MKITVRLFSHLVKYMPPLAPPLEQGLDGFERQLEEGESVASVIASLRIPTDVRRTATVNDENCSEERLLRDGDVVKIFPVAMGG